MKLLFRSPGVPRRRGAVFAAVAAFLLPGALAAQATISGRVTAQGTSQPLSQANVVVVGTNHFAVTNSEGQYVIRGVSAGVANVRVMHVGYQEQKKSVTVPSAGTVSLDFALEQVIVQLQEMVSTATGPQRKTELGHAVTNLGDIGKKVEETPIHSMGDLLTAKAPGVSVLGQGSTGSAPAIRIRGLNSLSLSNAPILFVDGVRAFSSNFSAPSNGGTTFSFLNSFSPEEIDDIEIVKGPSAATLYGTDAANGVILITTKKGRAGNAKWTWTAEQGIVRDPANYPDTYAIWGHSPSKPDTQIRCWLQTMDTTTPCIQDSVTHVNILKDKELTPIALGNRSLYGMQVSGGTQAVRYFVSTNLENEIGPLKMPGFAQARLDSLHVPIRDEWMYPEALQKLNVRANLNAAVNEKLDLSVDAGFSHTDNRIAQTDNNSLGIWSSARENPGFTHAGLGYTNVGSLGEVLHGYNRWIPSEIFQEYSPVDIHRLTSSSRLSWRPTSWLQNDGTIGMDLSTRDAVDLCRLEECPNSGTIRQGTVSDTKSNNRLFTFNLISNATWNFRPWLNLKTTVGSNYVNNESESVGSSGTQLPPGGSTVGQSANKSGSNSFPTATKTLGMYVQEQFSVRDRMWITTAVRTDQNSAFGTNFQRVFYPKASVSWLLSDEDFFPRYEWLNQLRLRTAYGASGVQPGSTSALRTFSTTTANIETVDKAGLRSNALGNPDLKPETSAELEGGFDIRILRNRVNFEFTYYNKKTKDALINQPIAASSAASQLSPLRNVGSIQNTGIETVLNGQVIEGKLFAWDMTLSASHASNKIVSLGKDPITGEDNFIGTGTSRQRVGYPISSRWDHPYTWSDVDKNGRIADNEVVVDTSWTYLGYQTPRDIISVQNGFDFFSRALRITALLDYKGGHTLFDSPNSFMCQQYLACPEMGNPDSPLAMQARAAAYRFGTVVNGTRTTSGVGYAMNGQFWRLREVSATVSLPAAAQHFIRSNGTTVTFAARNLKFWTKYTGADPESNYGSGDVQSDFNSPAPPSYFTVRLNLKY